MKVLVVDVGGSHGKVLATGRKTPIDKKGPTYEDYVGKAGLKRLGKKKWRGNAKLLDRLPRGVRLGANANAFPGDFRLRKRDG
jgi:hypothetical protein